MKALFCLYFFFNLCLGGESLHLGFYSFPPYAGRNTATGELEGCDVKVAGILAGKVKPTDVRKTLFRRSLDVVKAVSSG